MIEFRALGPTSLSDEVAGDIRSVLAQPKRVALLAYLAIARPPGFHRRSTLLALFWPEQDERHARWGLNQSLRYLRGVLGASLVQSRGADEVRLDAGAIWCDVVALEEAFNAQRWQAALELYRGDLLQGFHLTGSAEFERWLEDERTRLRGLASRASWALADQLEADGEIEAAAVSARRAIALTTHDETGVRRLIQLLDRAGDRAGAVQIYEDHARRLHEELDVEPAPETRLLIAAVRSRTESAKARSRAANSEASREGDVEDRPGEFRQAAARRTPRVHGVSTRALLVGGAGLTLAGVVWWTLGASSSRSLTPGSIAVLPCATVIQDAEKRHLGETITEDLIAEVVRGRVFQKVIASQSVARHRGSTKPPQQIASELAVDALLYCEYRVSALEERMRVQLVEPRSGRLLWTDTFRRDATAAGATLPMLVMDALARADVLGNSGQSSARGPALETRDVRALALYRGGLYFLRKLTDKDLHQSIYLFNEAIARDSQFALPWVKLSRAYYNLGIAFGGLDPREAFPLMKQAAERALTLDNSLAEAHLLLGEYESNFGWNWAVAERRLREAIRLDPYAPQPLQGLAYCLAILGRFDEIPALDAQAIGMSPVEPTVWGRAGLHQYIAGRFDDALPFLTKGLELAPRLHPGLLLLTGDVYSEMGDSKRALENLRKADSLSGNQVLIRGVLGYAYALAGDSAAAGAILRELKRGAAGARSPAKTATAIGNLYIGLGERDSAFAWLDIAYQQRSGNLVHVLRTHGRRLASDARYTVFLDRVGLRPAVRSTAQAALQSP